MSRASARLRTPVAARGARRAAATSPPARPDDPLALSVWLRLLKARGLLLRGLRARIPEGLTMAQFDALAQLERRPLGMTSGELTRELIVTAGNVTGIVARLARRGLVERRCVPGDRRTVELRLSSRGRALMRRVIPRHRRDVQALLAGVPRADQERLRSLLGGLIQALQP